MNLGMKCVLCETLVELQDFCYGCEAYICQECNDTYPDVPGSKHKPTDHLKLKSALADLKKAQDVVDSIINGK
jgi:hypothetical protein